MINRIQNSYSPSFGKYEIQGDPYVVMHKVSAKYIHNDGKAVAQNREKLLTNLIKMIDGTKTKVITDGERVMVEEPLTHALLGVYGNFGNYDDNKNAFFYVNKIEGNSDYARTEPNLPSFKTHTEDYAKKWQHISGIKVPFDDYDTFQSDFYGKGYSDEFINKHRVAYEIAQFFDKEVSDLDKRVEDTCSHLLDVLGFPRKSKM